MAKRGRPKDNVSLYDKYIKGKENILIEDCRNGADNKGLCKRLGIKPTTFKTILKENPELKTLLQEGKDEADLNVQSALYKRAVGYDTEETITDVKIGEDGSAQRSNVRKVKRNVPPDVTAQIFWLKNRRPSEWRDKQDINIANDDWVEALKSLRDKYKNG